MIRLSPPDQQRSLQRAIADITSPQHLNKRRERSYPRVVKRARHNSYRVKKPGDHGTRHTGRPRAQAAEDGERLHQVAVRRRRGRNRRKSESGHG